MGSSERSSEGVESAVGGLRLLRRDSVGVNETGSGSSPTNPSPRRWAAKVRDGNLFFLAFFSTVLFERNKIGTPIYNVHYQ